MAQIGSKLRKATGPLGHVTLHHWCPACGEVHGYRIAGPDGPIWTFNGDYDKPTFSPSMRIFVLEHEDDHGRALAPAVQRTLCHYFLTDGELRYCGDSPHAFAGQNVALPDWPYAPGAFGGLDE